MSSSVKLSEKIVREARIASKILKRSVAGQIEYWAKIGKIAEENPELTYDMIRNILFAHQEVRDGHIEPYQFDD